MKPSNKSYIVVVGVDHSEASRLALREAFKVGARRLPSEVHVLNVQMAILRYRYPFRKLHASAAQVWSRLLRRLQHFVADELAAFQESQRRSGDRPFGHIVSHLRSDSPGQQIARLASELEADLVVVGTHGRGGLARLLMGSTAHAVVTLSPCPVLVVREKSLLPPGPGVEHQGQRHTAQQPDRLGQEGGFPGAPRSN